MESMEQKAPADPFLMTVLVPGIRTTAWKKLYESIEKAFTKGPFEVIFIGPYAIPDEFKDFFAGKNVRYIQDWGTPIRAQQIGLCQAKGTYITWASDDGEYLPGSLDIAYDMLYNFRNEPKALVMGKYYEGNGAPNPEMADNHYYYLSNHDASASPYLPGSYLMLNVGLVPRRLLEDVGGWDCMFEVCPMSYNDLAIRLQNYGVRFLVQHEIMFTCSHMPGTTGDHGPVHFAQIDNDQPLFRDVYKMPDCIKRIHIPLNNWEQCPERWQRRFGKSDKQN